MPAIIIVIDNGSEVETFEALESGGYLKNNLIKYIGLENNIGASGGFSTGMRLAIEMGADWVWGMDDDALPEKGALEQLLIANVDGKKHCLWSNVDEDENFNDKVKRVEGLILVGFLISRTLIEKVGYPDEKYYMYHDDTDYSLRIKSSGFEILKVRDSIIDHKGFSKRGNAITTINTVFGNVHLLNCEPYRLYYIFRNGFYVTKKGLSRFNYILKTLFLTAPKYLLFRP